MQERPIDMRYHAAFISYVVARSHAEWARPAEAVAMLIPLGRCLRVLGEKADAMTPRGLAYLGWLERRLAADAWVARQRLTQIKT